MADRGRTPVPEPPSGGGELDSKAPLDLGQVRESRPGGGLGAILDLSDPLREVYLVLLRSEGLSLEEMSKHPELEQVEALKIMVMTLVRQGQLERYAEGDHVKFRAAPIVKPPKRVASELWDALGEED